jgi:hypothetical protein
MNQLQTVLDALLNDLCYLQIADAHDKSLKINKEAIAIIKQMMQVEPVAYEFRTCPERVTESNAWTPCSKKQHEMYIRTPMFENWVYETRALFAAPQAVPAHLEEQPDGSVVDTRSEPQAVPEYVQRVVIPFESSLPYERNTA